MQLAPPRPAERVSVEIVDLQVYANRRMNVPLSVRLAGTIATTAVVFGLVVTATLVATGARPLCTSNTLTVCTPTPPRPGHRVVEAGHYLGVVLAWGPAVVGGTTLGEVLVDGIATSTPPVASRSNTIVQVPAGYLAYIGPHGAIGIAPVSATESILRL